ncbi:hypothetical protein ACETIH_17610 [Microvirga arabica]|uniref:O-antigen ligase family protein n=1 Tax=Microvirga arabica TaxID=1128671 RepID=A0ABV6YB40_9HYPH
MPPRLLGLYILVCVATGVLSFLRVFPESWQTQFQEAAIYRQLVPAVSFFAASWASKAYFRRRLKFGDPLAGAPLIFVLSFIVAPVLTFAQGFSYEGAGTLRSVVGLYGAFLNNVIIGLFFVTGFVFLRTGWRCYACTIMIVVIAATTFFIQFKILMAAVITIITGFSSRTIVISLSIAFVIIYAIGISYVPQALAADPNSGIRLAFVADAISSVIDTYGVGIGYGTESVRFVYRFAGMPDFHFLPDPTALSEQQLLPLLSTGVHNSFVQAMLRTGILGFSLLVAANLVLLPSRRLPRVVRSHAACLFCIIFIACFVNPALESPVQLIGIGFLYGYLISLRAQRKPQSLIRLAAARASDG